MTIIQAVQNNDLAEVLAQISAMVDLNITDVYGKTAIIYSVEQNSVEIFDALLNAGALLDNITVSTGTNIQILKSLNIAGVDVSAAQPTTETAQTYYDKLGGFGVFPQNPKITLVQPPSGLPTSVTPLQLSATTTPAVPSIQTPATGLGTALDDNPPAPKDVTVDISQFGVPYMAGQNSSPYPVAINIQPMAAKITLAVFQMDSAVPEIDANKINDAAPDDKLNKFMEAKGLPSFKQPGLPSLLETFMKMNADAVATFGGYVIVLLKAVKTLIDLLKNPTDPQNVTKITDTVSGLKILIQSVIKFITDTKKWMFDTFMGPLADIKIPSPTFVYNLGEAVPAFPVPIPIPPLNPTLDGVDDKDSFDLTKLDPTDLVKMNLLFNTPYLDKVDTNAVVEKIEMDNSSTELSAQQLKTVQMIKNVASFPIKLLVGFMNILLSAIIGAITFDFSKIGDLIKMLTPTIEGLTIFSGVIIDAVVPNFSKVFSQMAPFIKTNKLDLSLDKDITKLTEFTKNAKVQTTDNTGDISTQIENKVAELEQSINDLGTKKDGFSALNPWQLKYFIDAFKQSGITSKLTEINKMQSDAFIPDVLSTSSGLTAIYNLMSTINSLDSKTYDSNYNLMSKPVNENAIVTYYSGTTGKINIIGGVTEPERLGVINKFFNNYPQEPKLKQDIDSFLNTHYNYLILKDTTFFTVYNNTALAGLKNRFNLMFDFNIKQASTKDLRLVLDDYFLNIKSLLQINTDFPDTLKTATTNLFDSININIEVIKNNKSELVKEFQIKSASTLAEMKKNSLTPPNTDSIGDNALSYVNTMNNFPNVLFQILKTIFDFVLGFLPF